MQWDACYTVFQNGMKGLNSRLATCKIQSTNYIDQTSHCCSQTINSKHMKSMKKPNLCLI